jgi:hypothetical protein
LDEDNATEESLKGSSLAIINWQLSSLNNTLNAKGSYVLAGNICNSKDFCNYIDFLSKQ